MIYDVFISNTVNMVSYYATTVQFYFIFLFAPKIGINKWEK